jgi:hypothetical protein
MKKLKSFQFLLVLIMLTAATLVNAKAPVRARSTLLSLYTKSDVVAIGRFDKKQEVGTNRVNEGFTVVTTKTYFDVSTVLKGEPQKFVTIEDEEFRYQVQQSGIPRTAVFVDENNARDEGIRPGDTVLLFLQSDGESFTLADDRDGVRKISSVEQGIYSERIRELNSLFESKPVADAKVAMWLVRCAEHPATRWDGTHELLQGFRQVEWSKQKDPNGYVRMDSSVTFDRGREAAKALTDDLKETLTQILVGSDFAPASKSPALSDGDRELITLVKRWNPTAAARYLVGQLKSRAYSAHENAGMMFKVAELIGDGRFSAIYRQYVDVRRIDIPSLDKVDPQALLLDKFIRVAEGELLKAPLYQQD